MKAMETKDKVDIISKRADVINKKVIALLAIDGAIWLYGIKEDGVLLVVSSVLFVVISTALLTNILQLGVLDKKLKGFENE